MRSILKSAIFCLFTILSLQGYSQHAPRPHLFDSYASSLDVPKSELDKIFNLQKGNAVQLTFSGQQFTGIISTSKHTYSNLQNVVVKLANLQGAIFHVSKIINTDNTISYVGRIINEKYADGFELKNISGNYSLKKIKTDDIIQD